MFRDSGSVRISVSKQRGSRHGHGNRSRFVVTGTVSATDLDASENHDAVREIKPTGAATE
jgi:hypothetical protein